MARGVDLGFVTLWVHDVEATARFYEEGLGLKRRFSIDTPQGPYVEFGTPEGGAGQDAGSVRFCIADIAEARGIYGDDFSQDFLTSPFQLVFVHDDIPGVYESAVRAGATSVSEPHLGPCWGINVARLRDPNGLLLLLMERVAPKEFIRLLVGRTGSDGIEAVHNAAKEVSSRAAVAR